MSYLGKKGYTLFKTELTETQLKKIRQDLTVKPFSTHSNEVSYPVYRESEKKDVSSTLLRIGGIW